jgi:DNA (cytosine-5)-methyltransferase 1
VRLLDLYCGQGGASEGYRRAGFDVVGVDLDYQPRHPGESLFRDRIAFVQADALAFLRAHGRDFDAIHASPPCQRHSQCNNWQRGAARDAYPDLLDATRAELEAVGRPYVIENVVGAPLREDAMLCGTAFGLRVIRHRIFEASFPLPASPRCRHWSHVGEADAWRIRKGDTSQGALDRPRGAFVSPSGNPNREKGTVSEWLDAMGTPWMDPLGRHPSDPAGLC